MELAALEAEARIEDAALDAEAVAAMLVLGLVGEGAEAAAAVVVSGIGPRRAEVAGGGTAGQTQVYCGVDCVVRVRRVRRGRRRVEGCIFGGGGGGGGGGCGCGVGCGCG